MISAIKPNSLDIRLMRSVILTVVLVAPAFAQKGGGQAGSQPNQQGSQASQGQSSQGGSGQGLPGLTYAVDEWPLLGLPDVKGPVKTFTEGRAVICYKMAKTNSSAQPFVLQPLTQGEIKGTGFDRPCKGESDHQGQGACKGSEAKLDSHWNACTSLDENHPLLMGQELVVGIEVSDLGLSGVNVNQLKALNLNVTNQVSSPVNPSPVRPSFPSTSAGGGAGGGSAAGLAAGVAASAGIGDFWTPAGAVEPGTDTHPRWMPSTVYYKGDVVADFSGRHLYRAEPSRDRKVCTVPGAPVATSRVSRRKRGRATLSRAVRA